MALTGKSMTQLIAEVYEITGPFYFDRMDLHIEDALKNQIVENCRTGKYKDFGNYNVISTEDMDGYKFHLNETSWVMIRASGTEPLLRVYAESPDKIETDRILQTVQTVLAG
ncbi:MAG: hypothetical protein H7X71_08505 [Chitinophagales bacterium]|nr:hypothetical protein [Chitinophagales bacterium]